MRLLEEQIVKSSANYEAMLRQKQELTNKIHRKEQELTGENKSTSKDDTGLFREYSEYNVQNDPLLVSIESVIKSSKHKQKMRSLSKVQSTIPQSHKATLSTIN